MRGRAAGHTKEPHRRKHSHHVSGIQSNIQDGRAILWAVDTEYRERIAPNDSNQRQSDRGARLQRTPRLFALHACERQMPAEPFILDGWPRPVVKAAFYTLLN